MDEDQERRDTATSLAWLDRPHRIPNDVVTHLRRVIASWDTSVATTLVPTQVTGSRATGWPRKTARSASSTSAERTSAPPRPTWSGSPPRTSGATVPSSRPSSTATARTRAPPHLWHRIQVREAIGTAVWAHQVGDEAFERQGHRMIAEALADC